MFYRRKLLLGMLEGFGGYLPRTDFQKYLFLYTQKYQSDKCYHFVPYLYGCFSFQSYADKTKLTELGHLARIDDWELSDSGKSYLDQLDASDSRKIKLFVDKYKGVNGKQLVRLVYTEFPYYATKSTIVNQILDREQAQKVRDQIQRQPARALFTIGYEGLTIEEYLNKLISHDIRVLVDVRKNPISRKYGFSKSKLADFSKKIGVEYVHIPELGIDSVDRKNLHTQKDYDRIFRRYEATTLKDNVDGLNKIRDLIDEDRRVAVTCFEAASCMCHRSSVAAALSDKVPVKTELTHL
jgi:uncharacterized protein (DUF488 family)